MRLWYIVVLIVCFFMPVQADSAAVMTVIYPGVEVRRVNTEQWFSLRQEAVAVLGVGDQLRTDAKGRAYLTFDDDFTMLIMPNSVYELAAYDDERVEAALDGHAIHSSGALDLDYRLTLDEVTITQPSDSFAAWSAFEGTPVVISAAETLVLEVDGEEQTVETGEALYLDDGQAVVVDAPSPASAAPLIGREFGCPGTVDILQQRLNLRAGTGRGFLEVGFIENGDTVQVMGVNETRSWLRVQRFSGFGWVQSLAIDHNCDDLPVYPNVTGETNPEIFEATPLELGLLQPFYGTPDDDRWFYR